MEGNETPFASVSQREFDYLDSVAPSGANARAHCSCGTHCAKGSFKFVGCDEDTVVTHSLSRFNKPDRQ
ncbi:hypothetical protein LPTSP1_15520 [Leptospira johnsonii]|uniref:Uncharacterized protein n=1 Tax=Leptospira johnsonii TaxID=1917820 RepID=A0A2P2D1N1_9LEPT|nr:hypothetical protein LPTSP1_15520 [Leptospira johnsonii]